MNGTNVPQSTGWHFIIGYNAYGSMGSTYVLKRWEMLFVAQKGSDYVAVTTSPLFQ